MGAPLTAQCTNRVGYSYVLYLDWATGGHSTNHNAGVEHPQPAWQSTRVGPSEWHPLVALRQISLTDYVLFECPDIFQCLPAWQVDQVGYWCIWCWITFSIVPGQQYKQDVPLYTVLSLGMQPPSQNYMYVLNSPQKVCSLSKKFTVLQPYRVQQLLVALSMRHKSCSLSNFTLGNII